MSNVAARSHGVTVENDDVSLRHAVTVGRGPISDVAVRDETVVVANFADDTLAVLDADTLAVRGGVFAGRPTAVVLRDRRAVVAVSTAGDDSIAIVDTGTGEVLGQYPLSFDVTAVTASPDGKRVYAARTADQGADVVVIDVQADRIGCLFVARGVDTAIDVLRIDPDGRALYVGVTDSRGSWLVTVDLRTGRSLGTVAIGSAIRGLELGPDGVAYVLTSDRAHGGVLHFVDLRTGEITAAEAVADMPTQLALSLDGARAYVVDYDRVAVVSTDTRAVVATISVGARPAGIALDADRLYVADYAGNVTSYSVATAMPMLYAQFATAGVIPTPVARELVSASA